MPVSFKQRLIKGLRNRVGIWKAIIGNKNKDLRRMGQKRKKSQTREVYITEVAATANGALSLLSKKCTNASQN